MNKLIVTVPLLMSAFLIASCSNTKINSAQETPTNQVTPASIEAKQQSPTKNINTEIVTATPGNSDTNTRQPQAANTQQKVGVVKELVNGDLKCYVTLIDENGTEHNLGATFEICAESAKFLNNKIRATYEVVAVNDCQSAEPCGKTRQESLITKMEVLKETSQNQSQGNDAQILSNGKWTITIGNKNSWSGVNGTGNLTYKGCDTKNNCISLTGGRVTCREGKCVTGWSNGDYIYIMEQPITGEEDNPDKLASLTTLTVKKGDNVILNANGFKLVPSS